MRLSKSRYLSGRQCHRRLWWEVHEPDAPELTPDAATQRVFDTGHRVGEVARTWFPGGVLVDAPYTRPRERLAQTRAALTAGATVIYEAAFEHENVFAALDVLSRPGPKAPWTLTEVKSTTSVKEVHLPDVAVQTWVARGAGIAVGAAEVMHLDPACRHPDLSNLFRREAVTEAIEEAVGEVPRAAKRMLTMLAGTLPDVAPGEQCLAPYACPFFARCNAVAGDDHVVRLYRISKKVRAELARAGIERIVDVPDDIALSKIQQRQQRALATNETVVAPGLAEALAAVNAPIAFLDFETVAPAIPVWEGCGPYTAVAAQWSVHLLAADGSVEAFGWIASGAGDPRAEGARTLAPVLARAATVVAYNAPFEAKQLGLLAAAADAAADRASLLRAKREIVDLLPVVRAHVYHPVFGGTFSLKAVLPALVPGLGYDDLEVADGSTAAGLLERVLFDGAMGEEERERVRGQLGAYCGRDTEGLVELYLALRELGRRGE